MSNLVDIAIHIKENVSHDDREEIQDTIRGMNGVVVATSRDEAPHFIMIGYDPELIASSEIIKFVNRRGLHGQIVGL